MIHATIAAALLFAAWIAEKNIVECYEVSFDPGTGRVVVHSCESRREAEIVTRRCGDQSSQLFVVTPA